MASNHSATPGLDMTMWNEGQRKLKKELAEAGEPTLEAYLVASFTFDSGIYNVSVKGSARRNIREDHPAYSILNKSGTGSANTLAKALRIALDAR
tara:strand:- start:29 stop:313 length:285 start_codon:yes stop_codon:yes gene_type:complete